MNQPNDKKYPSKLLPLLICTTIAGVVGMALYQVTVQFNWPKIYGLLIPVIISVPVALLGAYGWEKGFKNLTANDVLISIMGGVGASIGAMMVLLFS